MSHYLPQWENQDLKGARLLVFQWGGYGDQILFIRWFKELRERDVRSITFVCPDKLMPLLEGHPWIDHMIPTHEDAQLDSWIEMDVVPSEYDYFTSVVGMARRLFIQPEDLRWDGPYIRAPRPRELGWGSGEKGKRGNGKPFVGLCWKAGEVLDPRKHRSMTVAQASRLLAVDSVQWVNLTYGEPPPISPFSLLPFSPALRDWADTANIVAGLDLVISVDTGVAHLAGAMGKPCWVVLPSFSACWYGVGSRLGDTNWFYPSFRCFRNPAGKCGMDTSVDDVVRELRSTYARLN
jgi:Glycosyltransferase family 9 (heptosyltransferase)